MTTNRANGGEANNAEDAESNIPYPVALAQVTLGAMFVFMSLGWLLLTANAIFESGRPFTDFFWALPAILAVAVLFLLVTLSQRILWRTV